MTSVAAAAWILAALTGGVILAAAVSWIPGFHIYNLMGFLVLATMALRDAGVVLPPDFILAAATALVVTFAMMNSLPAILFNAPDESAVMTVLPGQQFLMAGRGWEAVMLTACGGLGAAFLLLPAGLWLLPVHLPRWHRILRPHTHWILWSVIVFMLMSEWPRGGTQGQGGWRKWLAGWRSTGAGLLTFGLAGLFGFILMIRAPVSPDRAFQSLMPAFVGLFAVPGLVMNVLTAVNPPRQQVPDQWRIDRAHLVKGILSGGVGGAFAAYFPGITGGVGGFLAGHAAAQRDERIFLIAQGASKMAYYAGALLLFVMPGAHLTRSGAWLIRGLVDPAWRNDRFLVLGGLLLSAVAAFFMTDWLARRMVRSLHSLNYRRLSLAAGALIVVMVVGMTGRAGILIMLTGTGIGLIPLLYGSRRMNCLSVLMLPLACNMSGFGPRIAAWLGLI